MVALLWWVVVPCHNSLGNGWDISFGPQPNVVVVECCACRCWLRHCGRNTKVGCESGWYREVYLWKLKGEIYEILVSCKIKCEEKVWWWHWNICQNSLSHHATTKAFFFLLLHLHLELNRLFKTSVLLNWMIPLDSKSTTSLPFLTATCKSLHWIALLTDINNARNSFRIFGGVGFQVHSQTTDMLQSYI